MRKVDFSRVRLLLLDFDGVLTDNTVYVNEHGEEQVRCWRSDGIGLSKIKDLGIDTIVVSTEKNNVVRERCNKLKLECTHGVADKGAAVRMISEQKNIQLSDIAFVGNDINDLPALGLVGYPVGVQDCHPGIIDSIRFKTVAYGGRGAVREVCDWIIEAHCTEENVVARS